MGNFLLISVSFLLSILGVIWQLNKSNGVKKNYFKTLEPKLSLVNITHEALHWMDFVMATGSFSSHWVSYLYLNIKCSSPAEKSLCRHKWKAGPFLFVNGDWMFMLTSGAITCFMAAGSLLQLSKCLSVNSNRLYVQNFVLPVFATFPIREMFNSERPFSEKIPN